MKLLSDDKMRVGGNFDKELIAKVDVYAKKMGLSRTAAMSALIGQQLEQMDAVQAMVKLVNKMEE